MEYPDRIPEADVLVVDLLASLVELDLNFVLALLGKNPRVEYRISNKVEVHLVHLKPLLYLNIQKSSRIEGHIRINILLVIEASLKTENA